MLGPLHRTPKHELEPLLDERGEGGLALGRLETSALEECFVQANSCSHASEHTSWYVGMSIWQWDARGPEFKSRRSDQQKHVRSQDFGDSLAECFFARSRS